MLLAIIIACEIGFWVAILAGLIARYGFKATRVGAVLLLTAPALDMVLLVATAAHLGSGATATWHHGLAALYIGFSIAYGHRMVTWTDVRFAHRFADGPIPRRTSGAEYTKNCWGDVARTLVATLVAAALIGAMMWWVRDEGRTQALTEWFPVLAVIVGFELLWALSYTLWPRKAVTAQGHR